ncbi:hypothetical protein GHT06_009173 [Daphnia sinensis]|uniref:Uncharacterized protein n=1 Tax=Daphnia sinensis TaxID=1820382 RepID=A0AAD5PZ17_9CRUS|nr:hypothetical protein GHT06_009173 [Daphnia sinensis]
MAFRVREGKVVPPSLRSDHLANRYVMTGPMSHGPGGGWRMPAVRVVGPQSHHSSFAPVFDGHRDPPEDNKSSNSKYLFRSSQPHLVQPQAQQHLWAGNQQQPGSLRGHPHQPGSLRSHPPMLPLPPPPPSATQVGGALKKQQSTVGNNNSQPLRRAVSFLERPDLVQPKQTADRIKQSKSLKFQEDEEVTYDPWAVESAASKQSAKDSSNTVKKMGRSKSFMDASQNGAPVSNASEGKVRKMLRKSASILYPSWLAAARRNSQSHHPCEQQQSDQHPKKESPPNATSNKRPAKEEGPRHHQALNEVEDLNGHPENGRESGTDATLCHQDCTQRAAATGDDDYGWESMEKNDGPPATTTTTTTTATTGKSVVDDPATTVGTADVITGGPAAPRRSVQLPRLGERNRIVVQPSSQQQSSPTVGDHPHTGSVLSSSSSSTSSSTLPNSSNRKPTTSKWHISSGGPKSLAVTTVQVGRKQASVPPFKSAERRWQSLIVLPDSNDVKSYDEGSTIDHHRYPVSGSVYGEMLDQQHKRRNKSTTGLMAAGQGIGGSASFLEIERDYATVSWEDLSDSHLYHHLHPMKAQSHTSLAIGQHSQQPRMISCPSYESLDDYLITSDDDSRRHSNRKATSDSISHSQSQLVYCDSFESLPRPPPPADADYSPPDISPDDSSETHRGDRENRTGGAGKNRVRVKLQRLPTFIQRQEAWQRKPWNQRAQQQQHQLKVFSSSSSGMIPEADSPEPAMASGHNWRSRTTSDQEEEEVDEEEEDDDDDDLSRAPDLIHHRSTVAVTARGGGVGIKRSMPAGNNNPDPVYWHDWLPPPAALLDCGCGLCRVTASMNASGTYQLRAPMPSSLFAPPQPPNRPPPPHVFPPLQLHRQKQQQQQQQQQLHHKYQLQQQRFQQQMRQLPAIFGHAAKNNHSAVRRDASFQQQSTAKPPPLRKIQTRSRGRGREEDSGSRDRQQADNCCIRNRYTVVLYRKTIGLPRFFGLVEVLSRLHGNIVIATLSLLSTLPTCFV